MRLEKDSSSRQPPTLIWLHSLLFYWWGFSWIGGEESCSTDSSMSFDGFFSHNLDDCCCCCRCCCSGFCRPSVGHFQKPFTTSVVALSPSPSPPPSPLAPFHVVARRFPSFWLFYRRLDNRSIRWPTFAFIPALFIVSLCTVDGFLPRLLSSWCLFFFWSVVVW